MPSVDKGTIPNDLSIIGRWKILDNLRRSLLAPALLAAVCGRLAVVARLAVGVDAGWRC